ncbi:hypothetical protein LOD99_14204 [Oopsacas minuta]|uniref:Uncharacterized protein n=1 Tax=Oopsacas minuta TaxID=111878 RepID=A0AAV7KFJ2_9METZ|nr:hypothetical protein LOD99_14204 [Oopsacas minuta]
MAKDRLVVYLLQDLKVSSDNPTIYAILYHTSIHIQNCVHFENSKFLIHFKQLIHEIADSELDIRFLALLINLLRCFTIAQFFLDINTIGVILSRSFHAQLHGATLLKILSTGLNHKDCCRNLKSHHIQILIDHLSGCMDKDLMIELFRIINSVHYPESNTYPFESSFDVKVFLLQNILCYQELEEDLLLELIIFTGIIAINHESAVFFYKEGAVNIFIAILREKQEDDEFVLQIIYIFYLLLYHSATKDSIIYDSQIPSYINELMNDPNMLISSYSNEALNLLFCLDSDYANQIVNERFNWYNFQWLDSIAEQDK